MAAITEFDIDGFIGQWGCSNRYVKSYLNESGKNPVTCRVCSSGGDFLMALNIKDQFAGHGDVTVDISGYAASAATIIGLGAKSTKISNTSFYLIHPVLDWVEAWGYMNEDDIKVLIAELEKTKEENKKMTLVLAKAYADKTGKPVADILKLMKEEKWLNADEAKEWGFVDEVYNTTTKLNFTGISQKLNMMGLPPFPGGKPDAVNAQNNLVEKIVTGIRDVFSKQNQTADQPPVTDNPIINKTDMKKFEKLNGVLKVDALESSDNKGVYLNEEQLQALENSIADRDTQILNFKTNETAHTAAVEKLNALHPDVAAATDVTAKVAVIQAKLAAKPAVPPSGTKENKTGEDGVNWEVMNGLGHMKEDPGLLV